MTGPEVMDVARDAIETLLIVASPLMLVGLVVGVAISLLQALTQIQETTLVFVPKILAIFIAMLIALPFMADAPAFEFSADSRPHHQRLSGRNVPINVSFCRRSGPPSSWCSRAPGPWSCCCRAWGAEYFGADAADIALILAACCCRCIAAPITSIPVRLGLPSSC